MKTILFIAVLLFFNGNIQAQKYILAGNITNAANKPINGALIQAVNNERLVFTYSDADGLYYTEMIPEGTYEVNITIDSVTYLSKITLKAPAKKNRFYNFQLKNKKIVATMVENDPFMETALTKAKNTKANYLFPNDKKYNIISVRHDSTGKTHRKKK